MERRMSNRDRDIAHLYHESTKLFYLDLQRKPPAHKRYKALLPLPLPTEVSSLAVPTLEAVAATGPAVSSAQGFDLTTLAGLLFYSVGQIRRRAFAGAGEVTFRAAASAGGLYPIEVYIVCGDLPGLAAGVYHFSPADFALRCLRQGDYRGVLAQAAGDPTGAAAPGTLVFSAVFWRSAWKYRVRSYRYCFWDNGTIVANLLAAATAVGLPARVLMGFIDIQINHLLGLDGHREASTCLAPLGQPADLLSPAETGQVPPLSVEIELSSREEIDYPEVTRLHTASALSTLEEVVAWRGSHAPRPAPSAELRSPLRPLAPALAAPLALGDVIRQRGSTRR